MRSCVSSKPSNPPLSPPKGRGTSHSTPQAKGESGPVRVVSNAWNTQLYDQKHAFVFQHGAGVVELLNPKPGERILDLGSGTGHLTKQMADVGADVIGLDSAASMVTAASKAYPDIEFMLGDAADFAFAQPFDAVFSNATLHWVPQANEAAACIAQALKPNGRFVAEFGGHHNMHHVATAVQAAIRDLTGLDIHHRWYFPTLAEYAGVLAHAGLELRSAWLFERPTPLEGDDGMRNWISMFGGGMFQGVPADKLDNIIAQAEQTLRTTNYKNGQWFADYWRIRVVAVKT